MKIVTDCAADMSQEELKELGISEAPLYIQFPEGEVSSKDITADAFYDRLEAMQPHTPTTAMPSSGIFTEMYNKIAKIDKNILSLHISSGLSGTINAARGAAEQIKSLANVDFWDTLTLSGGERFQVIAAALAARAGWTVSAIQERLSSIRSKTEVIYTLDTLDYLARGGRIGRVKAMAGAFFEELGLAPPAHSLGIGGGGPGDQTGRMLIALEPLLRDAAPDAVLVYGDTNSTLAGALVGAKLGIPVAHVEAGLRSFDRRMPEELNRVVADHLSRWLFAPTPAGVTNRVASATNS